MVEAKTDTTYCLKSCGKECCRKASNSSYSNALKEELYNSTTKRKKIVEIYATVNQEEKKVWVDVEKTECTEIAELIRKMIKLCFYQYNELEVEKDENI